MPVEQGRTGFVPSLNAPHQVAVSGFELADDAAHMIAWLGRGPDYRRFVANDIESELYRQTPGAQLLSIRCMEKPEFRTRAKQEQQGRVVVTDVSVMFPVALTVRAPDGVVWRLAVRHCYEASNIHSRSPERQLRLNFTIVSHQRES